MAFRMMQMWYSVRGSYGVPYEVVMAFHTRQIWHFIRGSYGVPYEAIMAFCTRQFREYWLDSKGRTSRIDRVQQLLIVV